MTDPVQPYKEMTDFVERLIGLEKVPTKSPKALATIMVLTHNWLFGDPFAGLQLENLIERSQVPLQSFAKRVLGRDVGRFNRTILHNCLEALAEKHKVFEILTHERNVWEDLKTLEQELESSKLKTSSDKEEAGYE